MVYFYSLQAVVALKTLTRNRLSLVSEPVCFGLPLLQVNYANYLINISDKLTITHGLISCVVWLRYLSFVVFLYFTLTTNWWLPVSVEYSSTWQEARRSKRAAKKSRFAHP